MIDPHGALAPPGVVGEVYIAGRAWRRATSTASRRESHFVPHPIRPDAGRAYRTGDLGRWRNDDELEFVGRVDAQVKIRGFRVEPAEVSAVLGEHPADRAIHRDGAPKRHGRRAPDRVLHLARRRWPARAGRRPPALPGPAPARLHDPDGVRPSDRPAADCEWQGRSDAFARSRTACRVPATAGLAPSGDATERALCRIWADVLGVGSIDPDDDFFALGGHSLLAFRVVARVRRDLGAELPLGAIFDAPTIRALAARIRDVSAS